jgi:glycosyltransferase involved in cell wall biosynthesis
MTDRLRIAMVAACPFPYPRGTPVRIYRMAQALSGLGQEVHVITYHLGQRGQASPFVTHRIPNLNFYKKMNPGPSLLKLLVVDPILTLKILSLYKKYKFDIIHAHHVEGFLSALPLRFLNDIPIIFDMHTLLSTELQYYFLNRHESRLKKVGRVFDVHLPKYADHVIGVTDEIKNNLITNHAIKPGKISVIPNGIEFEHFSQVEAKREAHEKGVVLGFAGNFAQYQGIEIMLEALGILSQKDPQICLHLYSNDSIDQHQPLIKKLNISSRIKVFSSDFAKLPEQLAQTDILLNPRPDGAGHPLKLLNYMAAGKPIVSFAGSGHFLTHGENAWIIKENSQQAFADGINHLAATRPIALKIGRTAKKFVEQNFSWRSRGEDIIKIYRNLMRAKQ